MKMLRPKLLPRQTIQPMLRPNKIVNLDELTFDLYERTFDLDERTFDLDERTFDFDERTFDFNEHTFDFNEHTFDLTRVGVQMRPPTLKPQTVIAHGTALANSNILKRGCHMHCSTTQN